MVSVIACTIRDTMIENVFNNFDSQLWQEKELIIILNKDNMNRSMWEEKAKGYDNITVFQLPEEKTLGDCLNFGIEKSKFDIVAKFDDDDYYSPFYLSEAMKVFNTTDAQLVGKGVSFMYFENENLLTLYIYKDGKENHAGKSFLKGGTLMFRKNLYPEIKFPSRKGSGPNGTGTDRFFLRTCKRRNIKIYTTSRYNYVYIRRAKKDHTYRKSNRILKNRSIVIEKTSNFKHLVNKNFDVEE